jgi:hypothetical protein
MELLVDALNRLRLVPEDGVGIVDDLERHDKLALGSERGGI